MTVDWRLARSLVQLRDQVNALAPERSRIDDGSVGNAEHQARTSDHNPWITGPDGRPVVSAIDITHDPRGGFDSYKFADMLKANHDGRDKYVISNRRIWTPSVSPDWRPYHGTNPHDHHVHISVLSDPAHYDDARPWTITVEGNDSAPIVSGRPAIYFGSYGDDVRYAQQLLGFSHPDGQFGGLTDVAARAFQVAHKLEGDGHIGRLTWNTLLADPLTHAEPLLADWQSGYQLEGLTASVFGGARELQHSAYDNHVIAELELCVALPYRFRAERPRMKVTNAETGSWAVARPEDVGPWDIDDPYWLAVGARPQAETGRDHRGRITNGAGIDLSPALARAIRISGLGKVNIEFM